MTGKAKTVNNFVYGREQKLTSQFWEIEWKMLYVLISFFSDGTKNFFVGVT